MLYLTNYYFLVLYNNISQFEVQLQSRDSMMCKVLPDNIPDSRSNVTVKHAKPRPNLRKNNTMHAHIVIYAVQHTQQKKLQDHHPIVKTTLIDF